MENYIPVILVATAVFLGMILNLAAKPKFAGKLNSILILVAGAGALIIYGCGYGKNEENYVIALLRTVLAVCGIYVGKVDASAVKETWIDTDAGMVFFWIIHLIALYATASTAITAIGTGALQKIRLLLARWGELNLIYGVNTDSVGYGKSLMGSRKCSVVYIDGSVDPTLSAAITKSRCVLRGDENAVNADKKFLRSIGILGGKRKITLYALSKDAAENYKYAQAFLASLKEIGVTPEQTSLVIMGKEDSAASKLQVLGGSYGYGYVTVFHEAGLAARLLIQNAPPCDTISFDSDGKAAEDFEVLQVGFGQLGQAVLRQMVMNGQFEGSTFRAAVFAPDCESQIGYFANSYAQVLERYDITFHPFDARSRKMYEYILERRKRIKYVVLCTGSEKLNRELAEDLSEFFAHLELPLPIHQCTYSGIVTTECGTVNRHKLYQASVLSTREVDEMAMLMNHYYCNDESKTPVQHWMECNYFNRMSSRASADFIGAMLRAVGKTREQVAEHGWDLSKKQLNNLCRTEHLRWCAFHYCMGFSPMSEKEYDERAREYKKQVERDGKATIRIGKNMQQRTHACLIDWSELDTLSDKESKITGKAVDYKSMDADNVLAVPELLRLSRRSDK